MSRRMFWLFYFVLYFGVVGILIGTHYAGKRDQVKLIDPIKVYVIDSWEANLGCP